MKMKLLLMMMAWMPFMNAGILDSWAKTPQTPPPAISLLLVHDKPGVLLEVKGKYRLYDPKEFSFISTRFIGKRKFIQALHDGLKWGEEFPGLHQLVIVPDSPDITTLIDGSEYRGNLYVYDVEGSVGVINEVSIEDYLQSILVPLEKEQLPQEVLAAIAIAARTNAYYYYLNPKTPYWSLESSKVGYKGYAVTNDNSAIGKAIIATRHLIMNQAKGNSGIIPFPAQFGTTGEGIKAKISLNDAVTMAKKGANAAEILEKAFPETSIVLTYYEKPSKIVMKD